MLFMEDDSDIVSLFDEETERFSMELCGISCCDVGYRVHRKKSNIYVLEYIVHGNGIFRTAGREYHPSSGCVYLAHRGMEHSYWSHRNHPWTKLWFNFSGSLADQMIRKYRLQDFYFAERPDMGPIFQQALDEIRAEPDRVNEVYPLALQKILFHLSRVLPSDDVELPHSRAYEIRDFLEKAILRKLNIPATAKHFGLSVSHFNRIFHAEFGIPPYQWHLEQKLRMAQKMLIYTEKSIGEIASDLAFADAFYFSNRFKAAFGLSPSQWKKEQKRISARKSLKNVNENRNKTEGK